MMVKHIGFQVEILMAWRVHTPMWIGPRVGELSPSSDHQKKLTTQGKTWVSSNFAAGSTWGLS